MVAIKQSNVIMVGLQSGGTQCNPNHKRSKPAMAESPITPVIISRQEARAAGLKLFYTGQPCVNGHNSERFVVRGNCRGCKKLAGDNYYRDNKQQILKKTTDWHKAHPETRKAIFKKYRNANMDRLREQRKIRRSNPLVREKDNNRRRRSRLNNLDKECQRCKSYRSSNRHVENARVAKRRAALLNQTPRWANMTIISEFYKIAQVMSSATKEPHEVDHIVPLLGKTVCGLHVHYNLRVITKVQNIQKSNRLIESLL